jgi:hypothetical protein
VAVSLKAPNYGLNNMSNIHRQKTLALAAVFQAAALADNLRVAQLIFKP